MVRQLNETTLYNWSVVLKEEGSVFKIGQASIVGDVGHAQWLEPESR